MEGDLFSRHIEVWVKKFQEVQVSRHHQFADIQAHWCVFVVEQIRMRHGATHAQHVARCRVRRHINSLAFCAC